MLFNDNKYWVQVRDGNEIASAIFHRHYSYRPYKDGRKPKLFAGPGKKIVLIGKNRDALFVWRKFKSKDNQVGVSCSVFRNESKILSSNLIMEAEEIARAVFGDVRLYTYINPKKVKTKKDFGYCFKMAGWRECGITKINKLIILEKQIQ